MVSQGDIKCLNLLTPVSIEHVSLYPITLNILESIAQQTKLKHEYTSQNNNFSLLL